MCRARTCAKWDDTSGSRGRCSEDEGAIEIHRAESPVFLDLDAGAGGHAVEAQIVLRDIDLGQQLALERLEARQIDLAFEDRFLDALSRPFACLCHASQSSPTLARLRVDVVADDHEHRLTAR